MGEWALRQKTPFRHTICASFISYTIQAIVNNFAPLLFLTFWREYGISLDRISLLVTLNFGVQLTVDLLSSRFLVKIGYRIGVVGAHLFAGIGLIALAVLPSLFPDPFTGLVIAVMLYGVGGGLLEVLVSPIVEACPTENKAGIMSLLHSFYCWGQLGVVAISTLFFAVCGIDKWPIMACVWASVALLNGLYFTRVPLRTLEETAAETMSVRKLLGLRQFWLLLVLMLCAGACELSISQWASAFTESALGVSKTVGDLLGPCVFAVLMGIARIVYAKFSDRLDMGQYLFGCAVLCLAGYLLSALASSAVMGLLGCALCGFAVGVMWPGTYSMAAVELPGGGTALFALLALGGDIGCSVGPTVVGVVSGLFGDRLQVGLLAAAVFPLLLIISLLVRKRMRRIKS